MRWSTHINGGESKMKPFFLFFSCLFGMGGMRAETGRRKRKSHVDCKEEDKSVQSYH